MNRELLAVRPEVPAAEVRDLLRTFAVGAVPVTEDTGRLLGVVSIRDLFETEGTAADKMTKPAIVVTQSTPIEEAGRRLALANTHHLVVVDGTGSAVGMVSSLDLLRGVLGMPSHHPATFPHWDPDLEVSWTDEWPLDENGCARAPQAAGVLVLVSGAPGERDAVVWAEDCANVQERALALVSRPLEQEATLAACLGRPGLRARAAVLANEGSRQRAVIVLRDRLGHAPPPGAT